MVIHALNKWIQTRMGFSTGLHLICIHWQGEKESLFFARIGASQGTVEL
jgi:hypothetical protein